MRYEDLVSIHHRRSIRLRHFDYASDAMYFITICTQRREKMLAGVIDGKVLLHEYGKIVARCWRWLEKQYSYISLDSFIVMPDHFHGLIAFGSPFSCRGFSPDTSIERKTLGSVIGAFKTVSAKQINILRGCPGTRVWQRDFYERIVRHEAECRAFRYYIGKNPEQWDPDR